MLALHQNLGKFTKRKSYLVLNLAKQNEQNNKKGKREREIKIKITIINS